MQMTSRTRSRWGIGLCAVTLCGARVLAATPPAAPPAPAPLVAELPDWLVPIHPKSVHPAKPQDKPAPKPGAAKANVGKPNAGKSSATKPDPAKSGAAEPD